MSSLGGFEDRYGGSMDWIRPKVLKKWKAVSKKDSIEAGKMTQWFNALVCSKPAFSL